MTRGSTASPYEAALISIRWFEADANTRLSADYLRKILLELGFTHPIEANAKSTCPGVRYCKAAMAGGGDCGRSPCAVTERGNGG